MPGSPAGNPTEETLKRTHKTIQLVTDHIERLRFNTAIAAMMDHLNHLAKLKPDEMGRFPARIFYLIASPNGPPRNRRNLARPRPQDFNPPRSDGPSSTQSSYATKW